MNDEIVRFGYFDSPNAAEQAMEEEGGRLYLIPESGKHCAWLGRRRYWLSQVDGRFDSPHVGQWYWYGGDIDQRGLVTVFEHSGGGREHLADAVNLRIGVGGETAQQSILPDRNGFLIRIWPAGHTHEQGGDNSNCLSLVVKFENGEPKIESFNWWGRTP